MLTADQLAARVGRVTSSVASVLYGTRKDGKEPAARRDLRMKLALERVTGQSLEEPITSKDIERGNELEPQARAAYEMATGQMVTEVEFVAHADLLAGTSPDGLVGEDGVVEFKCPRPANHYACIKAGLVPDDYFPQVVHHLWVTGRAYCDFVSFCPVMPPELQLFVLRYHRREADMASHELLVRQFLSEVDSTVDEITSRMESR